MTLRDDAHPLSVDARPERTGDQRIGVLLSHGFTGSPASMRPWGEYLAARGYAVAVPRLPGHGTTWQEMNRSTYDDWYAEVQTAYRTLSASCDVVLVGGLSMGGSLALRLAADHPEIAGVMLVNPGVIFSDWRMRLLPVLKHVVPSLPGIGSDIKKPGTVEGAYDRVPLKALHSMTTGWAILRDRLAGVRVPVRYWHSTEDHVVDDASARIIRAAVPDVTYTRLEDSYHVATLDNDAEKIFAESVEFIDDVVARSVG